VSPSVGGLAAIAGFGDAYGSAEDPGGPLDLAATAIRRAVADAGITRDDVDGLLTSREPLGDLRPQWHNILAAHLKLYPRYSTQVMHHAAGAISMLGVAATAVATGQADVVVCVQADTGAAQMDPAGIPDLDSDPDFERPYAPTIPTYWALQCQRYMFERGITEADLARVVLAHQSWTVAHPLAARAGRGELTASDVLHSRRISGPLRALMCSAWRRYGTAGALVVTTTERARQLTASPLVIRGWGQAAFNDYFADRMGMRGTHPDLGPLPTLVKMGAVTAGRHAYAMAGLGPGDVRVAQLAAPFAHVVPLALEELGFCPDGEGPAFLSAGQTEPGGSLPANTNGGWLGFGQAGVSCNMDTLVELVRQLRGQALGHQVAADIGLAYGLGGELGCHAVAILEAAGPADRRAAT
jgi:acetyl-CoA acetyltransferase